MKIIGLDPGGMKMGIALFEHSVPVKTSTICLVQEDNFRKFKSKGNSTLRLVENVIHFCENSQEWSSELKTANVLVVESQSLLFTHAISYAVISFVKMTNPGCLVHLVSPFTLSRHYHIGGLTRTLRKRKIKELVYDKCPEIRDYGLTRQDELDACFSIIYFLEVKSDSPRTKKTSQFKWPYYNCISQNRIKKSTSTGLQKTLASSSLQDIGEKV